MIRISRPSGLLRFVLRLPIYLFHAGLGGLLDHRFLLLTHRGRKSGREYEAVLEVVVHRKVTRTSFVISGWGDTPDWYRNIEAQPAVSVQVGWDKYTPEHHFLTSEEVGRVWESFRRKHPIEERIALRLYSERGKKYGSDDERRAAIVGSLRMVAFRPAPEISAS